LAGWLAIAFGAGLLLAAHVVLPAVYVTLSGPAPFAGHPAGVAALSDLLAPGARTLGLPIACALAAPRAWRPIAVALLGVAGIAALGAEWSVASLALLFALGGAGIERLIAGAGVRVLSVAAVIAVAGTTIGFVAVVRDQVSLAAAIASTAGAAITLVCAVLCRGRARSWAGPLLAAAAVGHSIAQASRALETVPRQEVLARPTMLPASAGSERISRPHLPQDDVPSVDPAARARRDRDTLAPAVGARFGFQYDRGPDRAQMSLLDPVWRAASPGAERFLDVYGLDLVVVPASVAVPSGMPIAGRSPDGELVLARNERHRPRAFTTTRWQWYEDDDAVRAELFPPARDLAATVRLATVRLIGRGEPSLTSPGPTPTPACRRRAWSSTRVALDCEAEGAGYAVLLDAWAPGWESTVDGEPARIERADLLVRAVRVTSGRHAIEFRYATPGLRWGAAIAALAWLDVVVLTLILLRTRSRTATG
jgi:hypothetical protein